MERETEGEAPFAKLVAEGRCAVGVVFVVVVVSACAGPPLRASFAIPPGQLVWTTRDEVRRNGLAVGVLESDYAAHLFADELETLGIVAVAPLYVAFVDADEPGRQIVDPFTGDNDVLGEAPTFPYPYQSSQRLDDGEDTTFVIGGDEDLVDVYAGLETDDVVAFAD